MTTLNLGITKRPCWIWRPNVLSAVQAQDFKLDEHHLYYSPDVPKNVPMRYRMRYRVQLAPEGLPRMLWAPDGFVLPDEPTEALAGNISAWGWYALILDPVWFLQLPIEHDGLRRHCPECQKMEF